MASIIQLLTFFVFSICASAETLEGQVIKIVDGDTITLQADQEKYRIRLSEIDTPEINQPWGKEAKSALISKIDNAFITVTVSDTDRYGRKVGKIWLAARDVNREMVREGHAWVYERYLIDQSLRKDQEYAIQHKLGLWQSTGATEPWEWRRRANN